MGSGIVPPGKELGLGFGNPAVGINGALGLGDLGRITGRTHDEEFIGAEEGPLDGPTILHGLLFRRRGVHHDHVHFFVFQKF